MTTEKGGAHGYFERMMLYCKALCRRAEEAERKHIL